jgi:hypothetical protein
VLRLRSVDWARAELTSARLDPGVKWLGLETGIPTGAGMDPGMSQETGICPSPGTALTDPDLIADREEGTLVNLSTGLAMGTGSGPLTSFSTQERGEEGHPSRLRNEEKEPGTLATEFAMPSEHNASCSNCP